MGYLQYGTPPEVFSIDDRTLAHVELVVLAKLRRNESFALSVSEKKERTTAWISPSSTIVFKFAKIEHEINRAWLEELLDSANTTAGLKITPEPEAKPKAETKPKAEPKPKA